MSASTRVVLALAFCASVTVAAASQATGQAPGPLPGPGTFGASPAGFAAYHPLRMTAQPKARVQNRRVGYVGPPLILAQSYVGRKAAEPTLGVAKNGDVFTVASAFDAIPGNPPKNEPRTLVERSADGGRTWKVTQPTQAGQNTMAVTTDPYIFVDPNVPAGSGRVFDIDLQGVNGAHLAFSDDSGQTWTDTVLTSVGVNDHQTLVSGAEPEGVNVPLLDPKYQKVLYYCVNQIGYGACSRSFDGGRTFVQGNQTGYQAVNINYLAQFDNSHNDGICGSLHGHAITDRYGRLFIPRGYCKTPMIGISSDAATTFHDVPVSSITMSGQQASVAADKQGRLYYIWQDGTYNQPYLAVSQDHGEHWGTPMMIAPPGVTATNFPTIDVGDPGRVAITFPGTTSTGGAKDKTRPWNSYVVMSTDALDANPLFLSNTANPKYDPVHRGDCNGRCGRMYDFLDIVSSPIDQGRVFATAVDTCTTLAGCSTSRVPGENDDDIVTYETGDPHGAAQDMQGVVIREVSGPALRGTSAWITSDSGR